MAPTNTPKGDQASGRSRVTPARVFVTALAAVLIAFCAWSMSEYVQGRDPLAFLGSSTETGSQLTSVADSVDSAAADAGATTVTVSVSGEDVAEAIESLEFDGQDLSLSEGEFVVVLNGDGIWVEHASGEADSDLVANAPRRAHALAAWAAGTGVQIPQVTWIVEDAAGNVVLAATVDVEAALSQGTTQDLLGAASGYTMNEALAGLLGVEKDAGTAPSLPDGTELAASSVASLASSAGPGVTTGSSSGASASGSAGSAGSGATGSSAGSTGSSSADDGLVRVTLTVDGSAAGWGSSTVSLALSQGSTVYDALSASGASVNARSTAFGLYVAGINGLAEFDHGGSSGWTYSVNGVEPSYTCDGYVLSSGDVIRWTYVNVTE